MAAGISEGPGLLVGSGFPEEVAAGSCWRHLQACVVQPNRRRRPLEPRERVLGGAAAPPPPGGEEGMALGCWAWGWETGCRFPASSRLIHSAVSVWGAVPGTDPCRGLATETPVLAEEGRPVSGCESGRVSLCWGAGGPHKILSELSSIISVGIPYLSQEDPERPAPLPILIPDRPLSVSEQGQLAPEHLTWKPSQQRRSCHVPCPSGAAQKMCLQQVPPPFMLLPRERQDSALAP